MAAHPVSLSEASGPPNMVGASRASAMTRREATTLLMGVATWEHAHLSHGGDSAPIAACLARKTLSRISASCVAIG